MILAAIIFLVVGILATLAGQFAALAGDTFRNGSTFGKWFVALCIAAPVGFVLYMVGTVVAANHH
jgi:ABC-type thiamin/hydroxymethylpyrimidine transport system permease subunit